MVATEETLGIVRTALGDVLQLGAKAEALGRDSPLLGAIAELDSMAVVHVLTALEDMLGIVVEDDEISADSFATLGSLADFLESKLSA